MPMSLPSTTYTSNTSGQTKKQLNNRLNKRTLFHHDVVPRPPIKRFTGPVSVRLLFDNLCYCAPPLYNFSLRRVSLAS